ncbi:hypothetical protein WH96_06355 [Kiloniella spongiae]|uniref:Uncharacterized protein n=1 Tax=Kiloniella spongiae TaxID=1489064 RepID=A0A0H2MH68_9PROT|nr:ankyrin repeat domain-containing protein [Kiloniella spongiae]KLN61894.1 hypothetical protein WH96_06355 [Kiloniella spongiae]
MDLDSICHRVVVFFLKWSIVVITSLCLWFYLGAIKPVYAESWKDCPGIERNEPLHSAVRQEALSTVKCLLKGGYNPDTLGKYNYSSLSLSVDVDINSEILDLLLDYGADVNINNGSALQVAMLNLGEAVNYWNSIENASEQGENDDARNLEQDVLTSLQMLFKLLDYGANYYLIRNEDQDPEYSHLVFLIYSVCQVDSEHFYHYLDYENIFNGIKTKSQFRIFMTRDEFQGIRHLEVLSKLGLFDYECLLSSQRNFPPEEKI